MGKAQPEVPLDLLESRSDFWAPQTSGYCRRAGFGVPGPHNSPGQLVLALGHPRPLYVLEELRTEPQADSGLGAEGERLRGEL